MSLQSLVVDAAGSDFGVYNLSSVSPFVALSPGLINSGDYGAPSYDMAELEGVGFHVSLRPGLNGYAPVLGVQATSDTKALIQAAIRGTGSLPYLAVKGGSTQLAFQYLNNKINEFKWGYADNDKAPLICNFAFMGLSGSEVAWGGPQPVEGSPVIMGYNGVGLIGVGVSPLLANEYGILKADGTVQNQLKVLRTNSAMASGSLRDPNVIIEGREKHMVNITTLMPIPIPATQDSPGINISFVETFTLGSTTIVFTYNGLGHTKGSRNRKVIINGEGAYENKLVGPPGCLVVT